MFDEYVEEQTSTNIPLSVTGLDKLHARLGVCTQRAHKEAFACMKHVNQSKHL